MHHIDVLMAPPDQPTGKTKLLGKWGTPPYPGAKGPDRTLIYKSTRLPVVSSLPRGTLRYFTLGALSEFLADLTFGSIPPSYSRLARR